MFFLHMHIYIIRAKPIEWNRIQKTRLKNSPQYTEKNYQLHDMMDAALGTPVNLKNQPLKIMFT